MKRFSLLFGWLAAAFALTFAPRPAAAELRIVATIPALAAVTKEIGGDEVSVETLALPREAEPRAVAVEGRHVVTVGLGLEVGWLPTLQVGSRNIKVMLGASGYIEAASFVTLLEPPVRVDRSEGDCTQAATRTSGTTRVRWPPSPSGLAAKMSALDPSHQAGYEARLRAFVGKLDTQRKGWEQRLAKRKGAPVIAYHRSWAYLADWVSLDQVAFLEPKPGVPPNPGHVAQVLGIARAKGVKILLQESYYPDATAKLVGEKVGASVLFLPSGPDLRAGQDYFAWMGGLVGQLEKAAP